MKTTTQNLIADLIDRTQENLNAAMRYQELPEAMLNWKASSEKWSALECLEHLNRYGHFYIPEIETRLADSKHPASPHFKSGWLGNYFAESMLPQGRKMKTFTAMDPSNSTLDKSVLDQFIRHQHQMLDLLDKSRKADLTKTKTSITISKWIKLRLGDTFRVVIYHNQRHIAQASRSIEAYRQEQAA